MEKAGTLFCNPTQFAALLSGFCYNPFCMDIQEKEVE